MQATSKSGNYDIFISCKSEDYAYAEQIYDYLVANGFNVFLASRELRRVGDSEYRRAITSALRSAYHLIVFASKAEYVDSEWVFYEWDMFINAKLKGFKQGNIFTILKDVRVDDISMDLWKYESMTLENYKDTLLGYVETPEHRAMTEKLEQERRQREKTEKERLEMTRQLKEASEDFNTRQTILNTLERRKITTILQRLNIAERTCPACGETAALDNEYCKKCGLYFNPADGIPEMGTVSITDTNRIVFHRDLSSKISRADELVNSLRDENEQLRLTIEKLDFENVQLKETWNEQFSKEHELKETITMLEAECQILHKEIEAMRQRGTSGLRADKPETPKETHCLGRTKISKVAKDLNLSVSVIIDFLRKNNIEIDEDNPNARIEGRAVELLINAFQVHKDLKTQSAQLSRERNEDNRLNADTATPHDEGLKINLRPFSQKPRILGKIELDKNGNPVARSNKTGSVQETT